MKIGRPHAIIVHYTVLLNLECCKSCETDMGPNTSLNVIQIIKRRLKSVNYSSMVNCNINVGQL